MRNTGNQDKPKNCLLTTYETWITICLPEIVLLIDYIAGIGQRLTP
jgi:hypothetical protein